MPCPNSAMRQIALNKCQTVEPLSPAPYTWLMKEQDLSGAFYDGVRTLLLSACVWQLILAHLWQLTLAHLRQFSG